jgi:uncharacterized membrane protein YccC
VLGVTVIPIRLDPLRARRAAQSALACVIALVLAVVYRLPHGYWSLVTIIVMTQPNVGASISKGAMRLVGTLLGAVLGVLLLSLVQEPVPFVLLLSAIVVTTSYLGAGGLYPYVFTILGVTAIIVSMSGLLEPEQGISIAVDRSAEVALGIIIALIVTATVWPVRAERELPRRLADTLGSCGILFRSVCEAYLAGRPLPRSYQVLERNLSRSFATHLTLIEQAGTESRFYQDHRQHFMRLLLLIERALASVTFPETALSPSESSTLHHEFRAELATLIQETEGTFTALERAIRSQEACPDPTGVLGAAYERLETRYADLRQAERLRAYAITEIVRFDSFVLGIKELGHVLGTMCTVVSQLSLGEGASGQTALDQSAQAAHRVMYWMPSLDRRRLKHGIKAALSVLIALFGWITLQ